MSPFPSRRAALLTALVAVLGALALVSVAPPVRGGTAVVFSEDFESGALGPQWLAEDNNPASGLDYWGVSDYRNHTGNYSAWASQVGNQSDTGFNNTDVQRYDDNQQADLEIALAVDGYQSLTLSLWYYSRAESGGGDFIQAWYEVGGNQTIIFDNRGGTGNAWQFVSVPVPTNVERLIIRFVTDGANHNFEGAYVDDIVMTGAESTAPSSTVLPLPAYVNVVPLAIPYAAADNPNASGIAYVELWYRAGTTGAFSRYNRSANPLGQWLPWASPTIPFDPAFAAGEGYYEFYAIAMDNASNEEAAPAAADASTTIDIAPPSLTVTAPAEGGWLMSGTVTVTWSGSDALTGIARYETSVDGAAFTSAGTATSRQVTGLADGAHTVDVRAVDLAANAVTVRRSFGVDATLPVVAITSPSGGLVLERNSITFEWTASDATSGIDHFEVWIDDASPVTTADLNFTWAGISDGAHTFHVAAVDRAGNRAEATLSFTVDTNPYDWLIWVLLAIVIVGGILFFLWWKRREAERETERRAGESPDQEPGRPPEPRAHAPEGSPEAGDAPLEDTPEEY